MPDTKQQSPADKVRGSFAAKTTQIKSRRDLNDEGRDLRLGRAYVRARDEMTKLKRNHIERTEKRRAHLQQRLFGNPQSWDSTATISYRDALDRVDRLKSPEEAAALLERAVMSGDEILGRAVAMKAMGRIGPAGMGNNGWAQVVDRWVEGQPPETAEYVQELVDIMDQSTSTQARFAVQMEYTLPRPRELDGRDVDRLAAQAEGLPDD